MTGTMHNFDLLLTLACGFFGAVVFGHLTQRLDRSPIVGCLLAGILVGPRTSGFVAGRQLAGQPVQVGAICQGAFATLFGALTARLFGWNRSAGIVFGLALTVASAAVLTQVLSDNGQLRSPTGRIAAGWLAAQDIFTVFVLVLLPVIFTASAASAASLILSTSGSSGAGECIRIARQINPELHVVSRVDFLKQAETLRKAGAGGNFAGEGEAALPMTAGILRKRGATPEQPYEERAQIRIELFHESAPELGAQTS
jgi:hypothetical protein